MTEMSRGGEESRSLRVHASMLVVIRRTNPRRESTYRRGKGGYFVPRRRDEAPEERAWPMVGSP